MKKIITAFLALFLASGLFAEEHVHQEFVDYFNEYNKTQFSAHEKLKLMNKKRNLEKLGKETVNGKVSGSLEYKAKVSGFYGLVTMSFSDYSDDKNWILNGNTNVKANMLANGKMSGTIEVSGKKPGKISYDRLLVKKGNAAGGFYTVELSDGTKDEVLWDEVLNENIANENNESEEDE